MSPLPVPENFPNLFTQAIYPPQDNGLDVTGLVHHDVLIDKVGPTWTPPIPLAPLPPDEVKPFPSPNPDVLGDVQLPLWIPVTPPETPPATPTPRPNPGRPTTPRLRPLPAGRPAEEDINRIPSETHFEMAERLLPFLTVQQKQQYWKVVGKALLNCVPSLDTAFELWHLWLGEDSPCSKDQLQGIMSEDGFRDRRYTIKTVGYLARAGNSDEYGKWHRTWYGEAAEEASGTKHSDVADFIYRLYWLDYLNTDGTMSGFMEFRGSKWEPDVRGVGLIGRLSAFSSGLSTTETPLRVFELQRSLLARKIEESTDRNFRECGELKLKRYTNIIDKLKSYPFRTTVVKDCIGKFFHRDYFQLVDADHSMLGVQNGVLSFDDKAHFRSVLPEDFVLKLCPVKYDEKLTWGHPIVEMLMYWFKQCFTDAELREHFLLRIASCLVGGNRHKLFDIWNGGGDNSKSMIKKLVDATFGPYSIDLPITVLTGKKGNSGAASPELAQAAHARFAFFAEPDDTEQISGGQLKLLTGGDGFFARFLHQNGGSIENTIQVFLMCNKIPPVPSGGQAVKNRLESIPFLSTWVQPDKAPKTENERFAQRIFPKDPFWEKRIPKLAPAFLWILFQKFPEYMRVGLSTPKIVEEHTLRYWQENSIYAAFAKDALIKTANEAFVVDRMSMLKAFRRYFWSLSKGTGKSVPDYPIVFSELRRELGDYNAANCLGWKSLQIKEEYREREPN